MWQSLCFLCRVGGVGKVEVEVGYLGGFGYLVNLSVAEEGLLMDWVVSRLIMVDVLNSNRRHYNGGFQLSTKIVLRIVKFLAGPIVRLLFYLQNNRTSASPRMTIRPDAE